MSKVYNCEFTQVIADKIVKEYNLRIIANNNEELKSLCNGLIAINNSINMRENVTFSLVYQDADNRRLYTLTLSNVVSCKTNLPLNMNFEEQTKNDPNS